ncbi:Cyclic di-GMP phosphodiesterase response regulator RpfG [Fundidesulfovibrio magnetotacticus]|uniref:Cyclic di-GMP phosphodiesterase response regulator RpfG n=1 Tax=Fundidesulfovibrio magnetotacticus TaxID=2730080 RepID=A0A6V8LPY6_9BACT|nr:HD-GYP domain-containing protein [Fundidesulfovibrio magnetotacticus]GFK94612.1 Cyclic di-GMP phosphodiesterase response regulator RpfG [Fundidesulfovibrio magnetotacticus]
MIKRIPVALLKPGMFVHGFDLSWFRHPFVSTRLGVVRDQRLVDELARLGVRHVEVDTERSQDLTAVTEPACSPELSAAPPATGDSPERPGAPRLAPCPPPGDRGAAVRFARKLFDHAMNATRGLMEDVSRGDPVDLDELKPCIAKVVESVNTNEDVLHLVLSLKAHDDYTYTHCLNLAALGVLLGKTLGLEGDQLELLGLAGMLHDVGKCKIPGGLVSKPGPLTPAEFETMKGHALLGYEHLAAHPNPGLPESVLRAVLEHHERLDGTGYPQGLARGGIHPFSSIISVVDIYDALTSDRVYRPRISGHLALRTLFNLRGQALPEELVDSFIKRLGVYPAMSVVQLRNGCYALVMRQTPGKPLFPEVMVFCDKDRNPLYRRRVDTWRLCGELSRKEFEIQRTVEPSEMPPPQAVFAAAP